MGIEDASHSHVDAQLDHAVRIAGRRVVRWSGVATGRHPAARRTNMKEEDVTVHATLLGGGYGFETHATGVGDQPQA